MASEVKIAKNATTMAPVFVSVMIVGPRTFPWARLSQNPRLTNSELSSDILLTIAKIKTMNNQTGGDLAPGLYSSLRNGVPPYLSFMSWPSMQILLEEMEADKSLPLMLRSPEISRNQAVLSRTEIGQAWVYIGV
jgi:hypothetical protein